MKIKNDLYDGKQSKPKDLLWQKRVYKKDDMREFLKLCKMLNGMYSAKGRPASYSYAGGAGRSGGGQRDQRCIVKCRIGKDITAHRKFLKEYMPQKNKDGVEEKPEVFGAGIAGGACFAAYERGMTGKHFKFIISPENRNVDMGVLVRALVKHMETGTGRRFSWLAAVHADTAHKHAHLLVNGVDKSGSDIRLSRAFITRTMRETARRICTRMVGKRTREETEAERAGLYKRNGYCALDGRLEAYEYKAEDGEGRYGSEIRIKRETELGRRLGHLEELGLARRKEGTKDTYLLESGWRETLRGIGRYNSFLKARREVGGKLTLYDKGVGEIRGKVTKRYVMNDEENWNHAIVIEDGERGKAWYVPLYYEPEREMENKEVRCEMKENQKGLLTPSIRMDGFTPSRRQR
jgi:hypothetical protein